MSYDINFYKSKDGRLTEEEMQEIMQYYEESEFLPEPYKISLAEHREIITEVKKLLPTYRAFVATEKGGYSFLQTENIDYEYAISIEVYEDSASISFPFWYDGEDLERIWMIIIAIADILHSRFQLWGYDSQSTGILDLSLYEKQKKDFVKISSAIHRMIKKGLD